MKNLHFIFLLLFSIFLTSCVPETSEIWFNKDGETISKTTLDLGESAEMMKSMVSKMATDSTNIENKSIFDSLEENESVDTTINMYAFIPDSLKHTMDNPEIFKNVTIGLKVKKGQETFKISLEMKYANEDERKEIIKAFKESSKDPNDANTFSDMFVAGILDMDRGIIRFDGLNLNPSPTVNKHMMDLYNQLDSLQYSIDHWDQQKDKNGNPLGEIEKQLTDMLLKLTIPMLDTKSEFIVHAPGEIISSNIIGAKIEGNTLSYKKSMKEMMEETNNNPSKEIVIKFKK